MMWHDGWGAGNWLVTSAMISIIVALVVVGVSRLVRGDPEGPTSQAAAREVLDEGFARGEITEPEYLRRRDLRNTT